jgi:hypothetical protein
MGRRQRDSSDSQAVSQDAIDLYQLQGGKISQEWAPRTSGPFSMTLEWEVRVDRGSMTLARGVIRS